MGTLEGKLVVNLLKTWAVKAQRKPVEQWAAPAPTQIPTQIPTMRCEALPPRTVTVRAPATSANVGAGFDAAALALDLFDQTTITVAPSGPIVVEIDGVGSDTLPRDHTHTVVRVLLERLHQLGFPTPGVRVHALNRIPQGAGLGSSAAAVVTGLLAAQAVATGSIEVQHKVEQILDAAAAQEGHADNAAACLLGGLVIAHPAQPAQPGRWSAQRLPVDARVQAVLWVPTTQVPTERARQALPPRVPLADAASNVAAAALLAPALAGRVELLHPATADHLHQQYRAGLMPDSAALVQRLREQGGAAFFSGAGPSVALLCTADGPQPPPDVPGFRRLDLAISATGASVEMDD